MKPAIALAVAAFAAVVAFLAGRATAPAPAPSAPSAESPATSSATAERELAAARDAERAAAAAREAAEREVAALLARVAEVEAAAAAATARSAADETAPTPATSGAAPRGKGIFWGGGAYEESLRAVDWKAVGENMHAMVPLLRDLGAAVAAGKSLPAETLGKIQQHNGPLVTAALKLGASVPGTGPNGKFSDPGFMVNAIASALDAAGLPLNDAQAASIEQAARRFAAEDETRRAGYDASTIELQKIVDEVELKDRFFDAAFALLRADQAEALTPVEVRHRVHGDIFSGALVWAGRVQVDTYADDAELASKAFAHMKTALRPPESREAELRGLVDAWVAALPQDVRGLPMDALSKMALVPNDHVLRWARQSLELLRTVERALPADDAARRRIRGTAGVAVLYRSATPVDEGDGE